MPQSGEWNEGHAVTVTGYSVPPNTPTEPEPDSGMLLTASRIDEFYVHDDQIGPFARLRFGGPPLNFPTRPELAREFSMRSSWQGRSDKPDSVCFAPEAVILPLYHKIRIGLDSIISCIRNGFDVPLETQRQKLLGTTEKTFASNRLQWDIYLTTSIEAKKNIRERSKLIDHETLWHFLQQPMARFLWRATAYDNETPIIDVLFDATDVEQGDFLSAVLVYSSALLELLISEKTT